MFNSPHTEVLAAVRIGSWSWVCAIVFGVPTILINNKQKNTNLRKDSITGKQNTTLKTKVDKIQLISNDLSLQ